MDSDDDSPELNLTQEQINETSDKVKEYAEITKTIKVTQEKLKVLNKRKLQLHKEVIPRLKVSNISKCNLSFGTLKLTTTKRKVAPTKTTIQSKYEHFFETRAKEYDFTHGSAEEKAKILYNYIYIENAEIKESNSLSMVYNKEFKEELKNKF